MTLLHDFRQSVDVAVVGAGPAGCAAAVQCRRFGLRVVLFDAHGEAGGLIANAFRVENHPGISPCAGTSVARSLQDHLARWEIPVERGTVSSLIPGE
jgi:thioredoxin reductase